MAAKAGGVDAVAGWLLRQGTNAPPVRVQFVSQVERLLRCFFLCCEIKIHLVYFVMLAAKPRQPCMHVCMYACTYVNQCMRDSVCITQPCLYLQCSVPVAAFVLKLSVLMHTIHGYIHTCMQTDIHMMDILTNPTFEALTCTNACTKIHIHTQRPWPKDSKSRTTNIRTITRQYKHASQTHCSSTYDHDTLA